MGEFPVLLEALPGNAGERLLPGFDQEARSGV